MKNKIKFSQNFTKKSKKLKYIIDRLYLDNQNFYLIISNHNKLVKYNIKNVRD